MKIRQGFVSNSSSSSFIVAFDKKPENPEELRKLLFGFEVWFHNPYYDPLYSPCPGWSTDEVAETVWNDIQEPVPANMISAEFDSGYIDGFDWDYSMSYDELKAKHASCEAEKFRKANSGAVFYRFEYADDNDYGAALEHGNLFARLPHVRVSHH